MDEKVKAAIAVFDQSAERTRPNAQTEAWATLRAYIEGLEADAARYRWLRDARCGSGDGEVEILLWHGEKGVVANDQDRNLDAALDAAREG